MNHIICCILLFAPPQSSHDPAVTIYNQNFAVVRQNVRLDLKAGITPVEFTDITAKLEPESVVLRDPLGKRSLVILEQNYQSDPISPEALLVRYEGQTLDFLVGAPGPVKAKIIRAGRQPYYSPYLGQTQQQATETIVEVNGQLRFGLPGTPVYPALGPGAILKPTLNWKIQSSSAGSLDAELSYITSGMIWRADYNLVAPLSGDTVDLVGWVTMENQSGRTFENARIKLMAGDVAKVQPATAALTGRAVFASAEAVALPVTEKTFDEYHLYTLEHITTLRDHETKQVEFLQAANVHAVTEYIYDGMRPIPQYGVDYRQNQFGMNSQPKVAVVRKIANSKANGLGMPLPKGRLRFYRRDSDGRLEFTGENNIDHTPSNETLRIPTGNAFDLTGERRRTDFKSDARQSMIDETYEIRVRNQKTTEVQVTVVEHLFRSANWTISPNAPKYNKTSANQIEFPITVPPGGEQVITYSVHYTW